MGTAERFSLKMSLQAHHLGSWTDENRGVSARNDVDRFCLARDFLPSFKLMLASVDGQPHPEIHGRFTKDRLWEVPTLSPVVIQSRLIAGGIVDPKSGIDATVGPLEATVKYLDWMSRRDNKPLKKDTISLAQRSLIALTQPDVDQI